MAGGDAEVAELEDAVRAEKEVLRLHVTVDETGRVGSREPRARLHAERRGLRCGQCPAPGDQLGERLPLDVLHRDERTAVVLTDVEDAHDVRVREPSRQTCLTEKAPPKILVAREVLGEPLQRHRPVELDVVSEVDGCHRAVTQRTNELIAAHDTRCGVHLSSPL